MKSLMFFMLGMLALFSACAGNGHEKELIVAPWGVVNDTTDGGASFDLEQIIANGEIIMLTLSGPESYYDYKGRHLGLHYLLCQKFADKIGVSLRIDLCRDTAEMIRKLIDGEGDVVAYWLSPDVLHLPIDSVERLAFCGPTKSKERLGWAVEKGHDALVKALDKWFRPQMLAEAKNEEGFLLSSHSVKRHVYAPMQDRHKGIISQFDGLFTKYGQKIRWDWRLLAAQCYQESTFDPYAKSWAGACGLMQIMPSTASHLGLPMSEIFIPEANIEAATRYLVELERKFGDIPDRSERINFVLASYNGGYHHIRDAMRLAAKNGKNEKSWKDVSQYVLLLAEPQYYRDPVVKYGYMRGNETVGYVSGIRKRWQLYRGAGIQSGNFLPNAPRKSKHQKGKYRLVDDKNVGK